MAPHKRMEEVCQKPVQKPAGAQGEGKGQGQGLEQEVSKTAQLGHSGWLPGLKTAMFRKRCCFPLKIGPLNCAQFGVYGHVGIITCLW